MTEPGQDITDALKRDVDAGEISAHAAVILLLIASRKPSLGYEALLAKTREMLESADQETVLRLLLKSEGDAKAVKAKTRAKRPPKAEKPVKPDKAGSEPGRGLPPTVTELWEATEAAWAITGEATTVDDVIAQSPNASHKWAGSILESIRTKYRMAAWQEANKDKFLPYRGDDHEDEE